MTNEINDLIYDRTLRLRSDLSYADAVLGDIVLNSRLMEMAEEEQVDVLVVILNKIINHVNAASDQITLIEQLYSDVKAANR